MLFIITVYRFGAVDELKRTLDSIASQKVGLHTSIIVCSNATESQIEWLQGYVSDGTIIIANQDLSLYDAMNIGLDNCGRGFVYFLNGGDSFVDSECVGTILHSVNNDCPSLFSTIQTCGDDRFLRDATSIGADIAPAHQGFVCHMDHIGELRFDLSLPIAADHYFMRSLIVKHGLVRHCDVIASFELGGISNYPCLRTVRSRYEYQGLYRSLLEFGKLFLRLILGKKFYYRVIFFKKFSRV